MSKPARLSTSGEQCLRNLVEGQPIDAHVRSYSAKGGFYNVRKGLQAKGYITPDNQITQAGRQALGVPRG